MKLNTRKVKFYSDLEIDEGSIVRTARPIERLVGVYFLVRGNRVVYVGMSTNVPSRLGKHVEEKDKDFERVFVLECKPEFVRDLELLYIARLRPEYNMQGTTHRGETLAFQKLQAELKREQDDEDRQRAEWGRRCVAAKEKECAEAQAPNAKVSGAGTASAGLPGWQANGETE